MPPPTTRSFLGNGASSSAPVESTMRGSSGRPGNMNGSEPAAIMQCSKSIVSSLSSLSRCADSKFASPLTTRTLRCLASCVRPPVRRPTTLFFHSRSFSASISGSPKLTPCSAMSFASSMTFAACNKAFDGIQPTFRQTPPSTGQRSTRITSRPRSAARNAAV